MSHAHPHCNRRQMIRALAGGSILLPGILQMALARDAAADDPNSIAPREPHFPAKAKRVIFLYMTGGVSHLDTFDPKPRLIIDAGNPVLATNPKSARYLAPLWEFGRGGKCGTEVSDLFPSVRECMDDICLIRSLHGDHNDHFQATLGMHTGSVTFPRPSLGSWASYGLGTMNQNLPSFIVLAPQLPYGGNQVWSSHCLPGCHSGTRLRSGGELVADLNRHMPWEKIEPPDAGLLDRFNQKQQLDRPADPALAAHIKSFETTFSMQKEMPEALDFSSETDATLALYGLERGVTKGFGWQCLAARRLAERGVRFIELIDVGSHNNWDAHGDMKNYGPLAKNVDRPIAGLLKDLKSRGMLDETLVVWTTEFGRTPTTDGPNGRGHQSAAFSSWLAGGGIKGGMVHGKTDDYGAAIAEDPVHVHDFHATILHCLGINHEKLTFHHADRDFRLTDSGGKVVKALLA